MASSLRCVLRFLETGIAGVIVVEPEPTFDVRGSFARTYCRREFAEHGIEFAPDQISTSVNLRAGTLRGLHIQRPPQEEAKLVSCTRGSAFDVAVDLRTESPTYARWTSVELTAESRRGIYIPPGCAHGFQTLEDDSELLYLIAGFYEPSLQRGVRWDDPQLAISWPREPVAVSDGDANLPDLGA